MTGSQGSHRNTLIWSTSRAKRVAHVTTLDLSSTSTHQAEKNYATKLMCVPSARFNQLQITLAITLFLIRTHGAFTSPCFASCPMRICLVPELYVIGLILLMCNWKTRFKHFRHLHRMLVFTIKKRKRKKLHQNLLPVWWLNFTCHIGSTNRNAALRLRFRNSYLSTYLFIYLSTYLSIDLSIVLSNLI